MKYQEIIFLQNDADEFFEILDNQGNSAAMDYLAQWDNFSGEIRSEKPWGTSDTNYRSGNLIMSYNTRLRYAGLCRGH